MKGLLTATLDRLGGVEGVRGALIVDAQAGVPVATVAAADIDLAALAALATALFGRLTRAAGAAEFGEAAAVQLDGAAGHLLVAPGGELLVVVVAEAGAQLEMLRQEVRRVAEELR